MNPISRLRSRLVARYAAADKGALTNYSFVAAIALSGRPAVSLAAFVLTVAGMHLGLLFWEMPSVSLTLGAPGLKPAAPGPISSMRKEEG